MINVKGDVKADGNFQDTPEDGKHATAEETRRAARNCQNREAAVPQRNCKDTGDSEDTGTLSEPRRTVRTQGHCEDTGDAVRTQ